ncbi:MAG: gliding motility-associated C-terminal domain-containing protein [Bacteroidia bacterium]|nr:gliding motility-associated C-terminal domain-containing protein [Bacteroidia bacterium]
MKRLLYIFSLLLSFSFFSSQTLSVQFSKLDQSCEKGSAGVQILSGKQPITIQWSTGVTNVSSINDLVEGDYSVTVKDSVLKDTVINFKIEKLECKVIVANHFTPNGDNYNDAWQIAQTTYYPEFELYVFNKWGQQVHSQKGTYIPWDGGVVADGTYYYVFYFKGSDKNKFLKGDVTILR